jgi:hypothetical protein
MSGLVVYDAGALIAADKNQRLFLRAHDLLIHDGVRPLLPAPVLSQVWLSGGKHAILHRVVSGCTVIPFTAQDAPEVARLCRKAGSTDVVDGFVAFTALRNGSAPVITSDIDVIAALLSGEPGATRIVVRRP